MVAAPGCIRLAVDIGGTFTDIVLERADELLTRKVLTTVSRPEEAVLNGVREILAEAGLRFADIETFVHGTTLATNAVLERRGAKTALIATEGFRDVLEIATEGRYDQYDLAIEMRPPLVPRNLRYTVPERLDAKGQILLDLDESAVRSVAAEMVSQGVESAAICFLHSYVNPMHENRVQEILTETAPHITLTLSSEVCPEIREYERCSTAAANAYVQPLIADYLARMEKQFAAEGFQGTIYLVASSGGLTSIETARRFPVRLIESGPAGGAIFAAEVAARAGEKRVLSFDMGGTTAKVCLIDDFQPESERVYEVDRAARFLKHSGLPLRIPVIDLVEIGAGGGSIAKVNALKSVEVGPDSAGSEPGPACYARGGQHPTVTDANVVLGVIDPKGFAGGEVELHVEAAENALDEHVASKLGMSAEMAAYAVHEIVSESMASAARVHAVEKGKAIGQYTLIAFGGAAPLHAARVAEKIGVDRVMIPPNAGVGSAVGFLRAPISYEVVRSSHHLLAELGTDAVAGMLAAMADEARELVEPGARGAPLIERRVAFMRYIGQGHEIAIDLPTRTLEAGDELALRNSFETEYQRLFQRTIPNAPVEIMSWSVLVSTAANLPEPVSRSGIMHSKPEQDGVHSFFDGRRGERIDIPRYRREVIVPGSRILGPALIAERETTTFISARFDAHIDADGSIILESKATGGTRS